MNTDELIVVPDLLRTLARQEAVARGFAELTALHSADLECDHGAVPGDRNPPCACWRGRENPLAGRAVGPTISTEAIA